MRKNKLGLAKPNKDLNHLLGLPELIVELPNLTVMSPEANGTEKNNTQSGQNLGTTVGIGYQHYPTGLRVFLASLINSPRNMKTSFRWEIQRVFKFFFDKIPFMIQNVDFLALNCHFSLIFLKTNEENLSFC